MDTEQNNKNSFLTSSLVVMMDQSAENMRDEFSIATEMEFISEVFFPLIFTSTCSNWLRQKC